MLIGHSLQFILLSRMFAAQLLNFQYFTVTCSLNGIDGCSLVWLVHCVVFATLELVMLGVLEHIPVECTGKCSLVVFLKSANVLKVLCLEAEATLTDRWSWWTWRTLVSSLFYCLRSCSYVRVFHVCHYFSSLLLLMAAFIIHCLPVDRVGGSGREGSAEQVLLHVGSFCKIPDKEFELRGHSIFRFLESMLYFFLLLRRDV